MRKVFIAAGLLALASVATPLMAQDAPGLSTQLQATLEDFFDRYAFPGVAAAIVLPDGTVVTAAAGLADVENARSMKPETPMPAVSIGKTFVAATVLALESEGSLWRADLLSVHRGDRSWFDALPNANRITIGQLLHHTVEPDGTGMLYGAGVAIYAETPMGTVYGHGGWISAYVSSLRHYRKYSVTVAFQANTDLGILDDSSDLVPALEAALATLAIEAVR